MNQANRTYHTLDLDQVFQALRQPVMLVEDRLGRDAIEAFIATARANQERAIIDLLTGLASAVNADATEFTLQLQHEPERLVMVMEQTTGGEADSLVQMEGDLEKMTIRLPSELKKMVDLAAGSRGVSVNTWCVWSLARSISRGLRRDLADPAAERRRGRHGGRRRRRGSVSPDTPLEEGRGSV